MGLASDLEKDRQKGTKLTVYKEHRSVFLENSQYSVSSGREYEAYCISILTHRMCSFILSIDTTAFGSVKVNSDDRFSECTMYQEGLNGMYYLGVE